MNKEYEVKILDIDILEIEKKLLEINAKREEKFFKIYSYKMDFDDSKFEEHIRLRDEGDKITLTYKKKNNDLVDGTQEIEFEVSSFESAKLFLSKFKFNGIYYQERKRIDFILDEITFSIDFWPKIPPFLEIEADTIENVKKGLKLLNLDDKNVKNPSLIKIYNKYGLDLHSFKTLKF